MSSGHAVPSGTGMDSQTPVAMLQSPVLQWSAKLEQSTPLQRSTHSGTAPGTQALPVAAQSTRVASRQANPLGAQSTSTEPSQLRPTVSQRAPGGTSAQ